MNTTSSIPVREHSSAAGEADGYELGAPPPDLGAMPPLLAQGLADGADGGDFVLGEVPPDAGEQPRIAVDGMATSSASVDEVDPRLKEADHDDSSLPTLPIAPDLPVLGRPEIYRIIREVVIPHSGSEAYSAVLTDAAYPGAEHGGGKAGRRFGLHFGLSLFTQESGRLGSVLRLFAGRDREAFETVFGADAAELLEVTGAGTAEARLATVGGEDLASPAWIERFREAGAIETCRYAQNEEAVANQFEPMLPMALALGLDSTRALAIAYDQVVARGLAGGMLWVAERSGVLSDEDRRLTVLNGSGHATIAEFQAAAGLDPHGGFDPATRVALAVEARKQGDVVLPTAPEICRSLASAAMGGSGRRLAVLLQSESLSDSPIDAD